MGKIDFKKKFKNLYKSSSKKVAIVEVPRFNFLMIDGCGDPNTSQEYKDAIEVLFSVSYKVKFMIKKQPNGLDYGVLPLEGLWWTEEMKDFSMGNKDIWKWTALIMQPEFVTTDLVNKAIDMVKKKKDLSSLPKLRFESIEEGLVAQIMHIGPYIEEESTVEKLHKYIETNDYNKVGKHHEIYLNNPRRTKPENLKTIIRQPIALKSKGTL